MKRDRRRHSVWKLVQVQNPTIPIAKQKETHHIYYDIEIPLNFIAIAVSCGPSPGRFPLGAHTQTCNCCETASRIRLEMKYFVWCTSNCIFTRLYCHLTLHWLLLASWCWRIFISFFPFHFQRHFSVFALNFPSSDSLTTIYSKVVCFHIQKHAFTLPVIKNIPAIVQAAIWLYQAVIQNFPPTAIKFHYFFNIRDLSSIFQVYIMG